MCVRPSSMHIHATDMFYIPVVCICLTIYNIQYSCAGRRIQVHTHTHTQTWTDTVKLFSSKNIDNIKQFIILGYFCKNNLT